MKKLLSLVVASALLSGCGDSSEISPFMSPEPAARVSSGTFRAGESIPLPDGAQWIEIGLIDGDSNRDLVVGMNEQVAVLLGNGDGTFQDPVTIANVVGDVLAVADLNGDGRLDVVASNLASASFNIIPNAGDGSFGAPVQIEAADLINEIHPFDMEGDGDLDLALSLPQLNRVEILVNQGNLNFTGGPQATLASPSAMAVADYNLDGRPDLGVALDASAGVGLLLNTAAGLVPGGSGATASRSFSAAAGDFNGDGRPDLATIELDDLLSVWYGDGRGGISPPHQLQADAETFQVIAANLNGDSHTDIVVATRESGKLNVFIANSAGGFNRTPDLVSPLSFSVAAGDVNGDGINDLVAVSETPTANVFLGQP